MSDIGPGAPRGQGWKCQEPPKGALTSPDGTGVHEIGGTPVLISAGGLDVLRERSRQITDERWTGEHDDCHTDGELSRAAYSYLKQVAFPDHSGEQPWCWPWSENWWKPGPVRRMLVKAAALILAEIDRLDRKAARGG